MARDKKKDKKGMDYVCPYCFHNINLDNVHRVCTNKACARMFAEKAAQSTDKKVSMLATSDGSAEIDLEKTIQNGRDPMLSPVTTEFHIVRSNSDCCDICGRRVYARVCPVCHNSIPQGAEEDGNSIFVILGPKGVGKSHYIAVLINQLKEIVAPEFNAVLSPANDGTTLKYRDMYFRRLFEEKRKLLPTKSFEESDEAREPLIYYLRVFSGDRPQVFTFAFFDTAGEDLVSATAIEMLNVDSFISKAAGIVYLVDPLQIRGINQRINMQNKPAIGPDVTDTLNNISMAIRKNRNIKSKAKIDTPLAVCLTKCDVLMKSPENEEEDKVLFGPATSLLIPREKGRCDMENVDQIDAELREYARRNIGEGFLQMIDSFEESRMFAVSALGCNPTSNSLPRAVSPFRVEDPFIWLLHKEGLR